MKSKNALLALAMIKAASNIKGYHIQGGTDLEIDFLNNAIDNEDDILLAGKHCTLFIDDLENCIIKRNTIYIRDQYILHLD